MSYVESMFSLEERVAVVTGGAGTLPSVIAAGLAKAGASVCIWGRGTGHPIQAAVAALRTDLEKTVGPEASGGIRIEGVTVDTGDRASVERAIAETEKLLGVPDLLVNGVGGTMGKSAFVDMDEEKFEQTLRLNLLAGLVTPTRVFARYWIAKGVQGDVINMTSMVSYKGLSGVWGYNAAKAGVLNLNEGLARELAPHGIRVNAIAPGFFIGYQNRSSARRRSAVSGRRKNCAGRSFFSPAGPLRVLSPASPFRWMAAI
jgi:NAD(P)-dependent dehydrogenase (short-subunit alcohol dehydrogenase family)